jgi:Tfp pilus assembly protein PilX
VKLGPRHAPRTTHHGSRPAPLTPHSHSGVALVVTLLLLSVITFMVVTFLVVSRSQKG